MYTTTAGAYNGRDIPLYDPVYPNNSERVNTVSFHNFIIGKFTAPCMPLYTVYTHIHVPACVYKQRTNGKIECMYICMCVCMYVHMYVCM